MKSAAIVTLLCAGVLGAASLAAVPVSAAPVSTTPVDEVPADSTAAGSELAGKIVFLDPGHQGSQHTQNLQKQVDDGRGGTKDCQTTGMTTVDGVAEHTINWKVSELVRSSLESLGADVVTSRPDDTGWGGCVDERAAAASASGADVAVSIHADSTSTSSDTTKHGFHLIVPTLPIPDPAADAAQSAGGRSASNLMRDSYVRSGFTPANYAGVDNGIQERADIAGPALTTVPVVFVEMGNGSNPDDAAALEGSDGQLKHAIAISTGIIDYLLGADEDATAAAPSGTTASGTTASGTTASGTSAAAEAPTSAVGPVTTSDSTPSTPTEATTPAAAGGRSALSRLFESVSPYVESLGVGGLESLVTPGTVDTVSNFARGLLKQILAAG